MGLLSLRPGNSLTILRWLCRSASPVSLSSAGATQAKGLLTLLPVGLPPTGHICFPLDTLVRQNYFDCRINTLARQSLQLSRCADRVFAHDTPPLFSSRHCLDSLFAICEDRLCGSSVRKRFVRPSPTTVSGKRRCCHGARSPRPPIGNTSATLGVAGGTVIQLEAVWFLISSIISAGLLPESFTRPTEFISYIS